MRAAEQDRPDPAAKRRRWRGWQRFMDPGHWKTTTFMAGLRHAGIVPPLVRDGPVLWGAGPPQPRMGG
jgi:hypothetical protein